MKLSTNPNENTGVSQIILISDQYKLYNLIWQRTIASQMSSAIIDSVAVDIEIGPCLFRANGSTIKHPGFLKVYEEGQDDKEEEKKTTFQN